MNLDYFKKIYRTIRGKLVLPMEKNIEKRPDYGVYMLQRNCWVPLLGVEGIAGKPQSQSQ